MRSLHSCSILAILLAVVAGTVQGFGWLRPGWDFSPRCPTPPPPAPAQTFVCQCNCDFPHHLPPNPVTPIPETTTSTTTTIGTTTSEEIDTTTDGTTQSTTSDISSTTNQNETNQTDRSTSHRWPTTAPVNNNTDDSPTPQENVTTAWHESATVETTTTTPYLCTSSDVLFIVDDSIDLGKEAFELEKEIVTELVGQLADKTSGSRVAMMLFSASPDQLWSFADTEQAFSYIRKQIADLSYTGKPSQDIAEAFKDAKTLFEEEPRSVDATSCYSRVAILLTNGEANEKAGKAAGKLTDKGVAIFAIAVGDNADQDMLVGITDRVISIRDSDDLYAISDMVNAVCNLPTICDGQE